MGERLLYGERACRTNLLQQVAAELGVSKSYAYKLIQKLNQEVKELGCITIRGRVDRK